VVDRLFRDPMAALVKKELQSLVRMPRFRVMFGMACVFSVLVVVPIALNPLSGSHPFLRENFLIVVTLYGSLLLSDVLILNVFGLDRSGAQLYFSVPISVEAVLKAKNLCAAMFLVAQCGLVLLVSIVIRVSVTSGAIVDAALSAAVVGIFLLSVGNLASVMIPRPVNPAQTFRKQNAGRMQAWLLGSSIGMMLLVGCAFLTRWAVQNNWGFITTMLIELTIGFIVYWIALESAVKRAGEQRERIVQALSGGASPVDFGA
jgi:ABC-2 type transport system permease protein